MPSPFDKLPADAAVYREANFGYLNPLGEVIVTPSSLPPSSAARVRKGDLPEGAWGPAKPLTGRPPFKNLRGGR